MLLSVVTGVSARRTVQAIWDFASWILGSIVAVVIRYDFEPPADVWGDAIYLGAALGLAQIVGGLVFQLYRGRYRIGSVDEIAALSSVVFVLGMGSTLLLFAMGPPGVPRSIGILAGIIALTWMLGGRLALRFARVRRQSGARGSRTVIYGAGDAGEQMLRLMLADRQRSFEPIGFLDDDSRKRHLRSSGVRVLGRGSELEEIAQTYGVQVLVVAIPGATGQFLRDLQRRCQSVGIALRALPTSHELLSTDLQLTDIANVSVEDLLGRRPVSTDEGLIRRFLQGKRVLITGAGGSIGSELARQVFQYNPDELVLLDRDETQLQAVEMQLDGRGLLDSRRLVLADIRDADRVSAVFEARQPQVVFHAAALKHLSLLESYPEEALKTNVLGTWNVLSAARAVNAEAFVNVSTDKAANPSSVLGYSKFITERLTAAVKNAGSSRFLSVRFGNVVGSRGSVLHAFRHQIRDGGPVCVTDFEATRFFMTVSEAVHLVLQAAAQGEAGATMILDMGDPVSIRSVAEQLIEASGEHVEIVEVGLREGEKLHEELVGSGEVLDPTSHPQVFSVKVEALELDIQSVQRNMGSARNFMIGVIQGSEV